jgi:hypothetical protein
MICNDASLLVRRRRFFLPQFPHAIAGDVGGGWLATGTHVGGLLGYLLKPFTGELQAGYRYLDARFICELSERRRHF